MYIAFQFKYVYSGFDNLVSLFKPYSKPLIVDYL